MVTIARSISQTLKRELFTPWREKDLRVLLSMTHDDFASPQRFVSGDPLEFESLTSNGEVFITFPFDLQLLSDNDQEPEATIRIMNVDDRIGSTILALPTDSVSVTLQVVLRASPDTVEYEATNLELTDVEINAMMITGRLRIRGLATEPCPGRILTKRISRALFR